MTQERTERLRRVRTDPEVYEAESRAKLVFQPMPPGESDYDHGCALCLATFRPTGDTLATITSGLVALHLPFQQYPVCPACVEGLQAGADKDGFRQKRENFQQFVAWQAGCLLSFVGQLTRPIPIVIASESVDTDDAPPLQIGVTP